jgi:predicted transcriptional regulator
MEMTNSRSVTETTIQILEVVNGYNDNEGITQTTLMTKLFLNHEQMEEHLMLLIEDDLISYDSKMAKFKTTEKGATFVQGYNQMDKKLKEHQS